MGAHSFWFCHVAAQIILKQQCYPVERGAVCADIGVGSVADHTATRRDCKQARCCVISNNAVRHGIVGRLKTNREMPEIMTVDQFCHNWFKFTTKADVNVAKLSLHRFTMYNIQLHFMLRISCQKDNSNNLHFLSHLYGFCSQNVHM